MTRSLWSVALLAIFLRILFFEVTLQELFGNQKISRSTVLSSTKYKTMSESVRRRIAYVTDVEGNIDYFTRYVERSEVLFFNSENGDLELKDDGIFIFGPGDIRIARLILSLKKRYPDRCYLLIGNRDANKLRFTSELSNDEVENRPLDSIPAIPAVGCKVKPGTYLKKNKLQNNVIGRLKWMLEETLGSPGAFEFRRKELGILFGKDFVSDDEVKESFLQSVQEDGFVLDYLKNAVIGVIIDETLFVHGGVNVESCGFVPDPERFRYFDRNTGDVVVNSVHEIPGWQLPDNAGVGEWINHLNIFAKACIEDYLKFPLWRSDGKRGGEALMAYQSTPATQGRGVIVPTFVNKGSATKFPAELKSYLKKSNINRVVVGHKPAGDSPLIMREKDSLEVIIADTSYSDPSTIDNRGKAVTEVIIEPDRSTTIQGILSDGKRYRFNIPDIHTDTMIGNVINEGFWVKAELENETFLLVKTEGRELTRKYVTASELKSLL